MDRISSLDSGYQTGDLSIYPTTLDTMDTLFQATNNAVTTLANAVSYNSQMIIVNDTSDFPPTGVIRIGPDIGVAGSFELVAYGLKTSNTFQQLKRGYAGSQQNTWTAKSTFVTLSVNAESHNALKDAVFNIETNLGENTSPVDTSLNGILKSQEVRFLAPKAQFRAFPKSGPPSLSVRFQNYTTGHILRYLWDFGDGGTSLEQSPTHLYVQEGVYTVKLNVITSTGAQGVTTKTGYITVSVDEAVPFFYVDSISQPYSVATASALTARGNPTQAKNFLFVDQTDGDIVQRNWDFGDGVRFTQNDPDIHTISHIYSEPGSYVVTLLIVFANTRFKKIELPASLVVL